MPCEGFSTPANCWTSPETRCAEVLPQLLPHFCRQCSQPHPPFLQGDQGQARFRHDDHVTTVFLMSWDVSAFNSATRAASFDAEMSTPQHALSSDFVRQTAWQCFVFVFISHLVATCPGLSFKSKGWQCCVILAEGQPWQLPELRLLRVTRKGICIVCTFLLLMGRVFAGLGQLLRSCFQCPQTRAASALCSTSEGSQHQKRVVPHMLLTTVVCRGRTKSTLPDRSMCVVNHGCYLFHPVVSAPVVSFLDCRIGQQNYQRPHRELLSAVY